MPKLYSLSLALLLSQLQLKAQYADTGTGALKEQIYWCNWAGFSITDGATKTFITSDSLTVTATFSNVTGTLPVPNYMSYAGYDFNNPSIKGSLNTSASANFKVAFTATRNDTPAPVTIAIITTGNATYTNACTTGTILQNNLNLLQSNAGLRQSSTAPGQSNSPVLQNNSGLRQGSTALVQSDSPVLQSNTGLRQSTVQLKSTTTQLQPSTTEVSLDKNSTIIFGILASFDRGDLPASFGYASHELTYSPCTLTPQPDSYLGAIPPDADTLKSNNDGPDEDAVTTFPPYTGNGEYELTIPIYTTTKSYISAWFDFNRNGTFDTNEIAIDSSTGATATLKWTNIPARLPAGKVSQCAFRFRISDSLLTSPTGYAHNGEVEDYFIALTAPCDVKVTTLADVILCAGKSTQLSATGATTYKWTPATNLNSDTIAQPIASPATTTKYTVFGTDAYGCTGETSLTVSINPSPVITTSKDTAMCTGTTIQLSGISNIPASYSWYPAAGLNNINITNPTASPATTTNYVVTASTIYGCRTSRTIHIDVTPTPVLKVTPDTPAICIGQSVIMTAAGGDEYAWFTAKDSLLTTNTSLNISPLHDTTFKVYIADYTCKIADTLVVPVIVYDTPKTTIAKSGDIDCANASINLKATGGIYYTWETAPGITNTHTASPAVSPLETTTYEVTIMDGHGCTNVENITVNVDVALAFTRYPIPSAFSPNGDGKNDCFGLKRWGETAFFEFNVFNRGGRIVYSSNSPNACWDGTSKGQPLPMGTYIYMIRARTICGDVVRKGAILLIR
ncbi:T9SS type B sorting domain-containing protein [Chitinophaga sancti]|uniref:CshA/CshB family fibrillar adhesin-related protein n=1 Tax=Chitinophaga sancti TaxID=1004 RepID=A0ABZ0XM72_9BACT|nr:gliding motility-associated C-terminal domain-containing protein [Chitinophaga sancti]WQG91787.1 CshA/CshB family fibrillar adhesin-related protein [Chitinophaga sancti]